jgi:hypothetical protein
MVTFRNAAAVGLFLFGASYLWLTPTFLKPVGFRGTIFEPKGLLAMIAILGFVAAAWGVFKDQVNRPCGPATDCSLPDAT